jgi:hypothetical protein
LVKIIDFENSNIEAEKDMRRMLFTQSEPSLSFFVRLNGHIDDTYGYNIDSSPVLDKNRAASLEYEERVLDWLIQTLESGSLKPALKTKIEQVADTMKVRIKSKREKYSLYYLERGWPEYLLQNIDKIPQERRTEIYSALKAYFYSDDKKVTGESTKARLSPADRLIKVLFNASVLPTLEKLSNEELVKQQAAQEKEELRINEKQWWQRLFDRRAER